MIYLSLYYTISSICTRPSDLRYCEHMLTPAHSNHKKNKISVKTVHNTAIIQFDSIITTYFHYGYSISILFDL